MKAALLLLALLLADVSEAESKYQQEAAAKAEGGK